MSTGSNPVQRCHLRLVPSQKVIELPKAQPPKAQDPGNDGVPIEIAGMPERLRALREKIRDKKGQPISQNQLSIDAGMSKDRVGRIERGERLDKIAAVTIVRLANHLRVSPDYLLTSREPPTPLKEREGFSKAKARAVMAWFDEAPQSAWEATNEIILPDTATISPELIRDCAILLGKHGIK